MFKILLFVTAGVAFVVVRLIRSLVLKANQNSIIKKVKKDPSLAIGMIDSLDLTYGKLEDVNQEGFQLIKTKILSGIEIKPYKILHNVLINENQLLVFSELSFTDFDVTIAGKGGDVSKKNYHNFILSYDRDKSQLTLFSDLYSDYTDKSQKEGFLKSLLNTEIIMLAAQ